MRTVSIQRATLHGVRRTAIRLGRAGVPPRIRTAIRTHALPLYRRLRYRNLPVAMITGTKGKTTTCRMLASILTEAGHCVGLSSTDGVVIGGVYESDVDSAGVRGARSVLQNERVTAAVLETARGDLIRFGMYLDRCDVAALLNVGREQIGIDGIESVPEMTQVKRRVADAARRAVVLNADDAECCTLIDDYPATRLILFSLDATNPAIVEHLSRGGRAYVLQGSLTDGVVERRHGEATVGLMSARELPSTAMGMFPQNLANALAAAALADGLGISTEHTRSALRSFENTVACSPGRFNLISGYRQTVLFDSAANPPSAAALVRSLEHLEVPGRRLCMFHTYGNRPSSHYVEMAALLAPHFDSFVCYEIDRYRRGREPGEIAAELENGLLRSGVAPADIATAADRRAALDHLASIAEPDDLVVILMTGIRNTLPLFHEAFADHREH